VSGYVQFLLVAGLEVLYFVLCLLCFLNFIYPIIFNYFDIYIFIYSINNIIY